MNKSLQNTKKFLQYTLFFITVYSILPYPNHSFDVLKYLQVTFIWWILIIIILFEFFYSKKYFYDTKNEENLGYIKRYLLWNILCIVIGMFIAQTYWDWKALFSNGFSLLLPIVVYIATNTYVTQSLMSYYIKYILPLFVVFAFLISPNIYAFYLIPISFLMLFFPVLTTQWKIILLSITFLLLTIDLSARSSVIKFGVPVILLSFYYFRKFFSVKIFEIIRISLIIAPIFFFILGVVGIFNIFQMDNYIKGDFTIKENSSSGVVINESSLKDDTRTMLYVDVLNTSLKYNSWLIGRSPARGNESDDFGSVLKSITGKAERQSNEVAILNIFTWTGIVGVILYFLIFFKATYLAVNRSKNIFSKMLGIYVAFRCAYAWVEDVNDFSLNMLILWLMIGLCFSVSFRNMNNNEVRIWIRGVFDVRYQYLVNKRKELEKKKMGKS